MELGEADDGELSDSDADTQTEDVQSRTITGDGLPDDNVRAAVLEDAVVERGLLDRLKQAASKLDRSDVPHELSETVDRPDFQDPGEKPERVPDRYSTPLERPDGTRTPLFDGVPVREQTKQGVLGDCGIIATLGAVAGHRPDAIRECVREGNDGNYQVCLHEAKYSMSRMRYEPTGRTINLVVTPELPIHDDEPERPSFADAGGVGAAWAPVLEKAIAGVDQTWSDGRREKWGERWKVQGGGRDLPTGYVRLNQGSNPSDRAELLTQLTGSPARTFELPTGYDLNGRSADRQLIEEFRARLAEHKPILVGTRSRDAGESSLVKEMHPSHAYEVTAIDDQGKIHLRNPWNRRHSEPLTVEEFRDGVRPYYSTLE
ncbi:hypothetical protein [Actinoallomurus iriomotensis]|uniref:Calpain catalytic domain-containing protein n=1 Tax=Actinoallomurus iriomotensis TaxID=478107 RepID=A0A9W6REH3_9ACTN|nr:hypothetical protein [Actinoallomurus iriomotensis]GLY74114.1 hypothetical protein Airi01_023810 [Actinoallomurus iriomotensis]